MDKEELFVKRIRELANLAYQRDITTFTDFLNLNERNILNSQNFHKLGVTAEGFGGYENAERQMIAFIPDALYYDWDFPIVCLHFTPAYPKYAEELTHRDVLGALMNLGIERAKIGDIRLDPTDYYVFASESISDYILDSLAQIRHTIIRGEVADTASLHIEQKYSILEGVVASDRLDNVIAFITKSSRSQSVLLIQSQKVFVNERIVSSNAYDCKSGDVISIRGFGKFIYEGSSGETRKGRTKITVKKYI